jgi:hypothetical protein
LPFDEKGYSIMGMLEDLTKGPAGNLLVSVGAAVIAPAVLPMLTLACRPLAKAIIKGGILTYQAMQEQTAEVSEHFHDLIAEVEAELKESAKTSTESPGRGTTDLPAE